MECKNPYTKTNVNVAQGPRTGNTGSKGKRGTFLDNKAERSPVAEVIERAYSARGMDTAETIRPGLESIRSTVKPKKFSR
jgi:hypothetical protein